MTIVSYERKKRSFQLQWIVLMVGKVSMKFIKFKIVSRYLSFIPKEFLYVCETKDFTP